MNDLIKKYTEAIKNRSVTNCYFSLAEIEKREANLKAISYMDSLILLEDKKDWKELYYVGGDWNWLKAAKDIKEEKIVRISCVGEATYFSDLEACLDFRLYKTYLRLRRGAVDNSFEGQNISFAKEEDTYTIKDMMDKTFDPFSDTIPTMEELVSFIQGKNVICEKDKTVVRGFVIFEDKGKTSYIRMVCIGDSYRGNHVGSNLMKHYLFLHSDTKGFSLWVDANNDSAIRLYEKFGYKRDMVVNKIFIKDVLEKVNE